MTDADQASYWKGVAERALAKQPEYEAQIARVREALGSVRRAIVEANPEVLICTLWMPDDEFMGGTVVDFIDHSLEALRFPAPADGRGGVLCWQRRKALTRLAS